MPIPEWVVVRKPPLLLWDETPDEELIRAHEQTGKDYVSFTPSDRLSVLVFPSDFVAAAPLPSDVLSVCLELADLGNSPSGLRAAVSDFCVSFGPLGVTEDFKAFDGQHVSGESLARWADEQRAMWTALQLLAYLGLVRLARRPGLQMPDVWRRLTVNPDIARTIQSQERQAYDAALASDTSSRERARERRARASARAVATASLATHGAALRSEAASRLRTLVNERLDRAGVRLKLVNDKPPFQIEHVASSLLARLWLRIAAVATERTHLRTCEICGALLVPTGERKRERMRSDKKTCSERCRKALFRRGGSR